MGNFKINFNVVIALVVMVAAIYYAFDAVQTESFSGDTLNITTSGVIKLTNTADEPAILNTSASRTYAITVNGPENKTIRPTREGSGRDLVYIAETEILPGQNILSVTRGSDVVFEINGASSLQATVGARSDTGNRNIVLFAAVVSLAALAYMSFTTEHSWLKVVTNRGSNLADTASPA